MANTTYQDDVLPDSEDKRGCAAIELNFHEPPDWMKAMRYSSNMLLNAGLVAALRTLVNPPKLAPPVDGSVPDWFADEFKQKTRGRLMAKQFLRDTAAFAAGCLVFDGVSSAMGYIRGKKDDAWNKVMGGVTAGGLLALVWYPGSNQARALFSASGACIGYLSFAAEGAANKVLLTQQRLLEKDLLHKSDEQLRPDLNTWYLRELLRLREQQLYEQRRAELRGEVAKQRGADSGSGQQGYSADDAQDSSLQQAGADDASAHQEGPAYPQDRAQWAPPTFAAKGGRAGGGGLVSGASGRAAPASWAQNDSGTLVIQEEEDGDGSR